MKNLCIVLIVSYFTSCSTYTAVNSLKSPQIIYELDLEDSEDDVFHVTVITSGLGKENNIYNLPATVPGTYSNLNFGRFVKLLKAYDHNGKDLACNKISENRWEIENSDQLAKLVYDIEDTFDTETDGEKVIPMAGTSISSDYIILNSFGVFGYFEGMQTNPLKIKIDYEDDWTIGTSLTVDENGFYTAESYDQLADSPFLFGDLSFASTTINDMKVGVYVYSPDTLLNANLIMESASKILESSAPFIGYSPVNHYNFLMVFLSPEEFQKNGFYGAGALEHSYSSLFVFPASTHMLREIQDDIAHEFLHILTPLNLHSEVIEPFNFVVPQSSEHIWLYEGVTEWASDIMQLRGGVITIHEYLERLSEKANVNDRFRKDISLTEMGREAYSESITMQFLNFYNRGAVVAAFLDIKLLELSNGKRGLREVLLELIEKYGKNKPFSEKDFFRILTEMTYPEIGVFIDDYIKGIKTLPYEEFMSKIGFSYIPEKKSEDSRPVLGLMFGLNDKQEFTLLDVADSQKKAGLQKGDILVKLNHETVDFKSLQKILKQISSMKAGDSVEVIVQRDGKNFPVEIELQQRVTKHIFEEMQELSEQQKFLRNVWQKNL